MSGKKQVNINLEYKPRPWQQKFHQGCSSKQFGIAIVARQHGKTELAVMEIINRVLKGPDNAGYGYVCPYANQTRRVFWPRLKKLLAPLAQYVQFRETDMVCTLPNGAKIYGLGGDNEAARGLSLRGLVIDEYDDVAADIYTSVLLPTTASYPDAFILFIGTLKRHGKLWHHLQSKLDDSAYYCQISKASEAGVMTEEQLDRYRLEMGDSNFLREFECSPFAPVSNSVIGDLMVQAEAEKRVVNFPVQPFADVHTCWDIGWNDDTSIWFFQLHGHYINIIDYAEFSQTSLVRIAQEIKKRNYPWGRLIVPHDGAVHDVSTGISRLQVFRDMNMGSVDHQKRMNIGETITSARLNLPRCRFSLDKCEKGINHLKMAKFKEDQKTAVVLDAIEHDRSSHAFDAFRYLCAWVNKKHPTGRNTRSFNQRSVSVKAITTASNRIKRNSKAIGNLV